MFDGFRKYAFYFRSISRLHQSGLPQAIQVQDWGTASRPGHGGGASNHCKLRFIVIILTQKNRHVFVGTAVLGTLVDGVAKSFHLRLPRRYEASPYCCEGSSLEIPPTC